VQGAGTLEGAQIAALGAASGVRTVVSRAGSITPFTMRVDQAPFSDVRVRQAMRLAVDRPGLIKSALDAYSTKITGWTTSRVGQPLSNFGFENFAFTG